jgi:hypothetical protein
MVVLIIVFGNGDGLSIPNMVLLMIDIVIWIFYMLPFLKYVMVWSIIGIPDVISYDVTCVPLNVVNLVDILSIFI